MLNSDTDVADQRKTFEGADHGRSYGGALLR